MTTDDTDDGGGDQAFRRTPPAPGRWAEMTYGGALSFLRRPYSRDAAAADVVVAGMPYDGATTFRPGARLGPRAIRAASASLAELAAFPFGFDPFDTLSVIDWGDCFLDPHHPGSIPGAIADHARHVLATGAKLLTLGGDHFVTWPLLKAHAERHGPLALVQFDAHADVWEDDGGRFDHGTMMLRALREGLVDPARSVQVGVRTHGASDYGVDVLTAPWLRRNGPEAALDVIRRRVRDAPAYVSFDIDCLDPAFAPGTGTPVAGGPSSAEALALVRGLVDLNIKGMDVMEVSPPYDHAEVTALAAATVAHDLLCVLARQSGAEGRSPGRL